MKENLPNSVRRWTLIYTFAEDEHHEVEEFDDFIWEFINGDKKASFYHVDAETGEPVEVYCTFYESVNHSQTFCRRVALEEVTRAK